MRHCFPLFGSLISMLYIDHTNDNRKAFCVSMRATAVQKECDHGNKNGAGDSNCIFRTAYPLEFLYRS